VDAEEVEGVLAKLGATVLFEKVLTACDANGSGRVVLPKVKGLHCFARKASSCSGPQHSTRGERADIVFCRA
jgi:hypothetical protein